MSHNTSTAVMARRNTSVREADLFPTPPWATRALVAYVLTPLGLFSAGDRVWEPAAGLGHMARRLSDKRLPAPECDDETES